MLHNTYTLRPGKGHGLFVHIHIYIYMYEQATNRVYLEIQLCREKHGKKPYKLVVSRHNTHINTHKIPYFFLPAGLPAASGLWVGPHFWAHLPYCLFGGVWL